MLFMTKTKFFLTEFIPTTKNGASGLTIVNAKKSGEAKIAGQSYCPKYWF